MHGDYATAERLWFAGRGRWVRRLLPAGVAALDPSPLLTLGRVRGLGRFLTLVSVLSGGRRLPAPLLPLLLARRLRRLGLASALPGGGGRRGPLTLFLARVLVLLFLVLLLTGGRSALFVLGRGAQPGRLRCLALASVLGSGWALPGAFLRALALVWGRPVGPPLGDGRSRSPALPLSLPRGCLGSVPLTGLGIRSRGLSGLAGLAGGGGLALTASLTLATGLTLSTGLAGAGILVTTLLAASILLTPGADLGRGHRLVWTRLGGWRSRRCFRHCRPTRGVG